jgi:hypothetical protein
MARRGDVFVAGGPDGAGFGGGLAEFHRFIVGDERGQAGGEFVGHPRFVLAGLAAIGDFAVELRGGVFRDAVHEIAEHVVEVGVDAGLEASHVNAVSELSGELAMRYQRQ